MVDYLKQNDRKKIEALYNDRFDNYKNDIKTVGWGSREDQTLRFEQLFRNLDLKGKKILDVGCGLGDLTTFLNEKTSGNFSYIGIDIAKSLIDEANRLKAANNISFIHGEVFLINGKFDYVVESGALTYKIEDNILYTTKVMKKMFELSNEAACLNFMTKYVDFELDKNFHYSPEEMFTHAINLTPHVAIFHDYRLWEFTLQLKKGLRK